MKRRPILTRRECDAAISAINAMLAGEDGEGDWPEEVTRDDLDGAADKLMMIRDWKESR